jgi:anthranilate phosphoribosyltransferase
MSTIFREFVRKIGSGTHTGQDLTREEAAIATRMILLQEATPAQIGAFLIAHRIKRPTGEELAGMLDAYDQLGPKLQSIDAAYPVSVMGSPYDGRSRTAPISPLTALVLATAACPVIQHGGRRMPTKEGDPLVDFWLGLGVDWTQLSLLQVQQVLEQTGVGFVYLPQHFPAAEHLVTYREEIGKRPPVATIELIWSPYQGTANQVAGFVHPPTETMIRQAYELRGTSFFTLVKGLEGSCDLPRERTAIISVSGAVSAHDPASHPIDPTEIQRLCLAPRTYGFEGQNVPLTSVTQVVQQMQATLQGEQTETRRSLLWNAGFYLWRCGASPDLETGVALTDQLLQQGKVAQTLQKLQQATQVALNR